MISKLRKGNISGGNPTSIAKKKLIQYILESFTMTFDCIQVPGFSHITSDSDEIQLV